MNATVRPGTRPLRQGSRLLALGLFGALLAVPTAASAAVNPGHLLKAGSTDELVIIEGYQPGSQATIDIVRGDVRIGTSGLVTVPGDGIVEINHPTDPPVLPTCWRGHTPDIVFGDVIRVTQGAAVETSAVRNVTVQDPVGVSPTVVEVHGTASDGQGGRLPIDELGVRLINPALQGLGGGGGGPFIEAPGFGTIAYNDPGDPTDAAWTATFNFAGLPAAYNAALSPDTGTEAGWLSGDGTEGTEVGVAPEPPEPGLNSCTEPSGQYAATASSQNVVSSATPSLVIQGAAPRGATSVSVTLSDGNPATTDPVVPGTLVTPPAVGGRTWSATFSTAEIAGLDNGTLTATPVFEPGAIVGIARTVAKTVDGTIPVTITSGPAEGSTSATGEATFTFTTPAQDATFECSRDGAAFTACTSPASYSGLLDGSHTFSVRAVDGVSPGAAATRTWTVALPGPDTVLTSTPPAATLARTATFAFTGTGGSTSFQCALDGAPFAACTSPVTLTGLIVGVHTFRVRAIDPAGTPDKTPAEHAWSVTPPDTERPTVTTSVGPLGKLTIARNGTLIVNGRCSERCTMIVRATVTVPSPTRGGKARIFAIRSTTIDSPGTAPSRLILRLSARQLRIVRNSLKAGKRVRITLTVVGTDAAGNTSNALRTIVLTKKNLSPN